MKNIFKIFFRDLKNISKNKAALIIIIGICVIPSLYAWINLKANWDPYSNTGNLPVAVVNEDKGAVVNGKEINIGDEIIDKLKDNKDIAWKFVTDEQGQEGVKTGEYYAMIEIPDNFSSLITNTQNIGAEKPDIIYLVNQKANAIATKITDVATTKLTEEIKSSMRSAVTDAAGSTLNEVGDKLKENEVGLIQFKDDMLTASSSINNIKDYMNNVGSDAQNFSDYLGLVKKDTSSITNGLNSLQNVANSSKILVASTTNTLNSLGQNVENNINGIQNAISQTISFVNELKAIDYDVNGNKATALVLINKMNNSLENANNYVGKAIKTLKVINNIVPSDKITVQIESLNKLSSTINNAISSLNSLKDKVNAIPDVITSKKIGNEESVQGEQLLVDETLSSTQVPSDSIINDGNSSNETGTVIDLSGVDTALNNVLTILNGASSTLGNISNNFSSTLLPEINNLATNLNSKINNADSIIANSYQIVPVIKELSNTGIEISGQALDTANQVNSKLASFSGSLSTLNDKLSILNNDTLNSAVNLLQRNTDDVSNFLSSPINVEQEEIYNSDTFGKGLTPFYTVLAIWVGALLLTSLLTVECEEELEKGKKVGLIEQHFGKMLLFIFLSLIQTTIVTLGDKLVLGIEPSNMLVMLGFAFLSSITFTIIIFTLVSLFGNIGKAMCVLIMVFQIAGSGGIYPIQTNPKLFQILQPIWPFTYAIDGFRQGIAGVSWSNVRHDALILICFLIVFLVLSLLKKPFHHVTESMSKKFKESGL